MSENTEVVAIVLAAGQGTRMKSERAKVLHRIAGRALVEWSVGAALEGGADECVVVVGHARDQVIEVLEARFGERVRFVVQEEQNGTGHAVACAMDALKERDGHVVVTYGDCPLVRGETLAALIDAGRSERCALLVAHLDDPHGYGRIVRDDGRVQRIVEHADCDEAQRAITEVNPGLYCFELAFLRAALSNLKSDNAQGELYLTDVIAAAQGSVADIHGQMSELRGVNDRAQLAECAQSMKLRINRALAKSGVGITDLEAIYIDADCEVMPDATLEAGVHLRGTCRVEAGARIDVGCVLEDVEVASDAYLQPYTVARQSTIGSRAQVGPFSHLRPLTELGEGSKVGNFCETKKTVVGEGSKVNHLAYVGDGVIGKGVNIGAGVIFCNYDGHRKHVTTLEDGVFIGSDSQLVAPLTVGVGAYVASGTTVTKDVPADALAISRTKQQNKEGYASRLKARFK